MQNSIFSQIKNHPFIFALALGLHVLLVVILTFNMSHTTAPKMPAAKKVDTVKAVIIDASIVEKEKQKLIYAEESKKNKQLAQKNKLDREAKKAREKRKKEEKRLANLKAEEKKRKQQLALKEKSEREKKNKELEKLKQEQKELEQKRRDEQQKLAAIEEKRKAEEIAVRKKKEAAEAEVRRIAREAEMRQQMLEEERRLAKRSAENQKLLSQYIYQIQKKVEMNWNAPASMTAGWSCEIMVEQNRFGEVLNVRTKQCSGSEAFQSTVERAVRKASPLPEAPNNDVFEKKLNFIFRPDV
ncbi:MAG: cell envelope integrity protein TolA [Gammaproteobacteria bacterium]|nr:cell envelope integrity protein TolA [Gammaproteobacteria bacterium]